MPDEDEGQAGCRAVQWRDCHGRDQHAGIHGGCQYGQSRLRCDATPSYTERPAVARPAAQQWPSRQACCRCRWAWISAVCGCRAIFCGVVGHRPTLDLRHTTAALLRCRHRSAREPLARNVQDVALLLSAMSMPGGRDPMAFHDAASLKVVEPIDLSRIRRCSIRSRLCTDRQFASGGLRGADEDTGILCRAS